MYGRINAPATACYAFGILVQLPFVAIPLYTGPWPARSAASIFPGSSD